MNTNNQQLEEIYIDSLVFFKILMIFVAYGRLKDNKPMSTLVSMGLSYFVIIYALDYENKANISTENGEDDIYTKLKTTGLGYEKLIFCQLIVIMFIFGFIE